MTRVSLWIKNLKKKCMKLRRRLRLSWLHLVIHNKLNLINLSHWLFYYWYLVTERGHCFGQRITFTRPAEPFQLNSLAIHFLNLSHWMISPCWAKKSQSSIAGTKWRTDTKTDFLAERSNPLKTIPNSIRFNYFFLLNLNFQIKISTKLDLNSLTIPEDPGVFHVANVAVAH